MSSLEQRSGKEDDILFHVLDTKMNAKKYSEIQNVEPLGFALPETFREFQREVRRGMIYLFVRQIQRRDLQNLDCTFSLPLEITPYKQLPDVLNGKGSVVGFAGLFSSVPKRGLLKGKNVCEILQLNTAAAVDMESTERILIDLCKKCMPDGDRYLAMRYQEEDADTDRLLWSERFTPVPSTSQMKLMAWKRPPVQYTA